MDEEDTTKVLVVTETYSPTSGGFIHSLRGALRELNPPEGPSGPVTYLTSTVRTKNLPDETRTDVNSMNINFVEPDWKLKPDEPSRDLLTKYHRDYFSRQIIKIPDLEVVVGTEPYTAQTASYLRDELVESYSYNPSFSRISRGPSSSKSSGTSKSYSKSSSGKSSSSSKGNISSCSSGINEQFDGPKFVIVNYIEGDECEDSDLPGERGLEFVENARESDAVISVGLRVYNFWHSVLHQNNIVHEPYIPFEPILSKDYPVGIGDHSAKAVKRVFTLSTGSDILSSEFHRRVAGILGGIAQIKADQYETNFLTWIVQVESGISTERKTEIRSCLAHWAKSKALKIQLTSPETRSQLEHQVVVSSLVLMSGMFHMAGYSGLECMMSSVPCLVPEDSDVGDVIRLEDALDTAFLLPPLGYTEASEKEWKKKILKLLVNSADAVKHARELRGKLEKSALFERSTRLFAKIFYGKQYKGNHRTENVPETCLKSKDKVEAVVDTVEGDLQVDMEEVEVEETLLGKGSMSVVRSGVYKGEKVAVKTIYTGAVTITEQEALRSVSIMSKLKHENVVRLIGFAMAEQRFFVLLELMAQSMGDFIAAKQGGLTEDVKLRVAEQCCAGLQYLHTRYILHEDLKPANILLSADMTPKIADFDIAHIKRNLHGPTTKTTKSTRSQAGAAYSYYRAPEVSMEKAHFWSDVWSMGGTLTEWFTLQPFWTVPQGQCDWLKVPEYILKETTPHAVRHLDPKILPILKPAVCYDKHQRPTAHEMQIAFEERRAGKDFKGYKKKKGDKKHRSHASYIRDGLMALLILTLGPLTYCARGYWEQYSIELAVAAVVVTTSIVLTYLDLIDGAWTIGTTLIVILLVVLLVKFPLGQIYHPSEPDAVAPDIPPAPGNVSDDIPEGSDTSVMKPYPGTSDTESTGALEEMNASDSEISTTGSDLEEGNSQVDPDLIAPEQTDLTPEPSAGEGAIEPEIPLAEQHPGVPVAQSPDDAERVLTENGHNKKELETEYEGRLIYKNKLLGYKLDGDIKWKGLKTKFKWRCSCWVSSTGQQVESEWFLGRASSLSDALRRLNW